MLLPFQPDKSTVWVTSDGVELSTENVRVEDYLTKLDKAPDFVLADPPRAGLGKSVVKDLVRLNPKHIVIVSCDPATLARDLAGLTSYSIERMTLVDLVPQPYHLQPVVHLYQTSGGGTHHR